LGWLSGRPASERADEFGGRLVEAAPTSAGRLVSNRREDGGQIFEVREPPE